MTVTGAAGNAGAGAVAVMGELEDTTTGALGPLEAGIVAAGVGTSVTVVGTWVMIPGFWLI